MSNLTGDRYSISDIPEAMDEEWIRRHINEIHTAIPARVDSFNPETGTVKLYIGVARDVAGLVADPAVLDNVPVIYQQAGDFKITYPLAEGDTGLVVFCEASIDRWLMNTNKKQVVNPLDTRMHDYSDGVFFPGLMQARSVTEIDEDPLISRGDTEIKLKQDALEVTTGKFCVKSDVGEMLGTIIASLEKINALPVVNGILTADIAILKTMECN